MEPTTSAPASSAATVQMQMETREEERRKGPLSSSRDSNVLAKKRKGGNEEEVTDATPSSSQHRGGQRGERREQQKCSRRHPRCSRPISTTPVVRKNFSCTAWRNVDVVWASQASPGGFRPTTQIGFDRGINGAWSLSPGGPTTDLPNGTGRVLRRRQVGPDEG